MFDIMTYKRAIGPLPRRGYFFRRNEAEYGGQLVAGVYRDGYEVQRGTWNAQTSPDTLPLSDDYCIPDEI